MTGRSGTSEVREHIARLQSIAFSGKAFVSSFPLVIVVAALSTNTQNNPGRAGGPSHRHP